MSTKSEVVSWFAHFHIYYICENMHYAPLLDATWSAIVR